MLNTILIVVLAILIIFWLYGFTALFFMMRRIYQIISVVIPFQHAANFYALYFAILLFSFINALGHSAAG